MEISVAIRVLAALAQKTRLAIFRVLVEQGSGGLAAGAIADALGLAPATLSFHLRELAQAGLIRSHQRSRFIYYRAEGSTLNDVLTLLAPLAGSSGAVGAAHTLEPAPACSAPPIAKPVVRPKSRLR